MNDFWETGNERKRACAINISENTIAYIGGKQSGESNLGKQIHTRNVDEPRDSLAFGTGPNLNTKRTFHSCALTTNPTGNPTVAICKRTLSFFICKWNALQT